MGKGLIGSRCVCVEETAGAKYMDHLNLAISKQMLDSTGACLLLMLRLTLIIMLLHTIHLSSSCQLTPYCVAQDTPWP